MSGFRTNFAFRPSLTIKKQKIKVNFHKSYKKKLLYIFLINIMNDVKTFLKTHYLFSKYTPTKWENT
jgi:hypothetical protein